MPPTWYSPRDRWPRHSKPELQNGLEYAKDADWYYKVGEGRAGHSIGVIYCRRTDTDESCKFLVNSTPKNPGDAEKDLRHAVDKCPHQSRDKEGGVADAESLYASASQNVGAAKWCIEEAACLRRRDELLDAALGDEDVTNDIPDRCDEEEERAQAAHARAGELAADQSALEAPSAEQRATRLLEAASADMQSAEQLLKDTETTAARRLRGRLSTLRSEIDLLQRYPNSQM